MNIYRYRWLILILYVLAALQISDAALWLWAKMVVQGKGVFVVEALPIAVCALIGTGISYFMVWKILKGIDAEVEAAIDGFADYIAKRLMAKYDKLEEGAAHEQDLI